MEPLFDDLLGLVDYSAALLIIKMEDQVAELKLRHETLKAETWALHLGNVVVDITETLCGAGVTAAIDEVSRLIRRDPHAASNAIRQAEVEIARYSDELSRHKVLLENALRGRHANKAALSDISTRFTDIETVVHQVGILEGNFKIQTALRLGGSAVRYANSRLGTEVTAAWLLSAEASSEERAVSDAKVRVDELECLVTEEQQNSDFKSRNRKLAQSTLELALSKLEGLARIVSDCGLNKNPEVQQAVETSEDAYFQAKKRFNCDDYLDAASAEQLLKTINDAEGVAKRCSDELQQRAKELDSTHTAVNDLVIRLATVSGLCDASGPLVLDRVHDVHQAARASVTAAVRLSRRESVHLDSALEKAIQDVTSLEKATAAAKDQIVQGEADYAAARLQIDGLGQTLRNARIAAESLATDRARGIRGTITEAEASLNLCQAHVFNLKTWLDDPVTAKALVEETLLKVELCEDELERELADALTSKREKEALALKQANLSARHEKVCGAVQHLKTAPPPKLLQAIASTDKAMASALSSRNAVALALTESLVKEEEDLLKVDVYSSEKRLLDLEKASTQLPMFLHKLALLDAQVAAAGVHVAALVETELSEARRAVRSVEHAIDADSTSPTALSLDAADEKVKAAEQAVSTHVRRVTNALLAQQDVKAQLSDVQVAFEELNETASGFLAKNEQLRLQIAGDMSLDTSPCDLSSRVISQAIKRSEQLVAHARRRIEVPVSLWLEYGPSVAQSSLENAREGIRAAKTVVDAEQAKFDSNDLERRGARNSLHECAQMVVTLRANLGVIADSSDALGAQDAIDAAERSIEAALRVLTHGTVSSSAAAIEVAQRKTAEADAVCTAAVEREEKTSTERTNTRDEFQKLRAKLDALKEAAMFLNIAETSLVSESLSTAERALIGVDLVLKCEFGLPMLRKEFQAATQAVDDFAAVVEREKGRIDAKHRSDTKKKHDERLRHQRMVEFERARAAGETLERRAMQDKLEAAIQRLQLHWPSVVDLQSMMTSAESSVEVARSKVSGGGLAAAKAAVSSALVKVHALEHAAKSIEAASYDQPPQVQSNAIGEIVFDGNHGTALADLASNIQLLQRNLSEVHLRIEKQNKIMALQSQLIMASNCGDLSASEGLRRGLAELQNDFS